MAIRRIRTVFVGVAGTPWYSNMYFDADGVTPTPQQNVDAVDSFWTSIAPYMDNAVSWVVGPEVPVLDETNGELVGVTSVTANGGVGTASDDALPYASQGLVRLNTNDFVNGRRVRGRIFLPGITKASASPTGTVFTTASAGWLAAATTLTAATGILVWARPLWNREVDPPVLVRPGSKAAITGQSIWANFAVMRSRRD